MTISQYASTFTPPPPTVTTTSGATTTSASAGTYSLWIYCRNRSGVTNFSTAVNFTITSGQGIQITLPSAIRGTASSFLWIGVAIALGSSATPNSGCVVATFPNYNTDGSLATLPGTIALTDDVNFVLRGTVAATSNLPTSHLVNGMLRLVEATNQIVAWLASSSSWVPVAPQTFNPYTGNSLVEGGSDVDISLITNINNIIFPSYNLSGSYSTPVTYWITNNTGASIPQGKQVTLSATINGNNIKPGLLQVTFVGYVNTTTAALDTSGMTTGATVTYQGDDVSSLFLQKDLPAGSAYILQVQAAFDNADIGNIAYQGAVILIYPDFALNYSEYDPSWDDFGDRIFNSGGLFRLLPSGTGLNLMAATGSCSVQYYKSRNVGAQAVYGLQANTPNQNVIITNNGTVFVAPSVPTGTGALRGVVGTVNGPGTPTSWSSSTIALSSSTLLTLTLTHPTTVSSSYPDEIQGSTATLNANQVQIYVKSSSGTIYVFDTPIIGTTGETVTVGSTAPSQTLNSLPTVANNFGLFVPVSFTSSTTAGSAVFSSGNYEVAIAYLYNNTVTTISHSTNLGCIPEVGGSIEQIVELAASLPAFYNSTNYALVSGQPPTGLGKTGDYYFDSVNTSPTFGNFWQKTGVNVWTLLGSFLAQGSFSITTASFTQPAINATVTVSIANVQWMVTGENVFIESAGYYQVNSVSISANTATLLNLGSSSNASPGSAIASGAQIGSSGATGATGPTGSISAAVGAIALTEASPSSITAVAGELQIFANSSTGRLEIMDPTGTTEQVATLVEAQQWSGYQGNVVQTINANTTTTTINVALGNLFLINLSSNTTITATNVTTGSFSIKITQASPGGFVVTWNTAIFKFGSGNSVVGTANGASTLISCASFDGTTLEAILAGGF